MLGNNLARSSLNVSAKDSRDGGIRVRPVSCVECAKFSSTRMDRLLGSRKFPVEGWKECSRQFEEELAGGQSPQGRTLVLYILCVTPVV